MFGLAASDLPEVVGCATPVGATAAFGPSLPVTGLAVDQQAALVGEACLAPGQAKCTYGTGAFLLVTTGASPRRSAHGLSASVAWEVPGSVSYCLDGQSYTAGAAVSWLVAMGLLRAPADLDAVAASVPDASGVTMVPALAGLGAPYWRPSAAGTLEGLGPAHVARPRGAGHPGGPGRPGGRAGRGRRRRPGRPPGGAPGGRRPDPVGVPDAAPGGPAPGARRGLRLAPRHRPRGGRAGPDGTRRRRGRARRSPARAGRPLRARDGSRRGRRRLARFRRRPSGPWPRRTGADRWRRRSRTRRVDVAVVGAGVVGCAVARHLALAGATVAVLDRAPDVGGRHLEGQHRGPPHRVRHRSRLARVPVGVPGARPAGRVRGRRRDRRRADRCPAGGLGRRAGRGPPALAAKAAANGTPSPGWWTPARSGPWSPISGPRPGGGSPCPANGSSTRGR